MDLLYTLTLLPIVLLMQQVLEWAYNLTDNYGYALIVLSLIVNILLLPIYYQAEKWRDADKLIQAKMQPMLDRIKANYSSKERYYYTQALYKTHNYSPFSSVKASAGFLIQIPFFFAAFHLLSNYQPFNGVSFGILADLGQADGLLFGINALPFLMTLINLLAAFVYIKNYDQKEKYQLWGIALLFLVLLYTQPAALLLYWTINNAFSLVKNLVEVLLEKCTTRPGYASKNTFKLWIKNTASLFINSKFFNLLVYGLFLFSIACIFYSLNGVSFKSIDSSSYKFISMFAGLSLLGVSSLLLFIKYSLLDKFDRLLKIFYLLSLLVIFVFLIYFSVVKLNVYAHELKTAIILEFFVFLSLFGWELLERFKLLNFSKSLKRFDSYSLFFKIFISILLLLFIITPSFFFETTDQLTVKFEVFFQTAYIYSLVIVLLFLILFMLAGNKNKIAINFIGLIVLLTSLFYSILINPDFGRLDHFKFEEPDLLVFSNLLKIVELIFILFFIWFLYQLSKKYFELLKASLNVLFAVIILTTIYQFYSLKGFKEEIEEVKEASVLKSNYLMTEEFKAEQQSILSFSKDKNILIFFLDGFGGGSFQEIIDNKKELLESYSGFTWYRNTISSSISTFQSTASMLGGVDYSFKNFTTKDRATLEDSYKYSYKVFPDAFKEFDWSLDYLKTDYIDKEHLDSNINLSSFDYSSAYLERYMNVGYEELSNNLNQSDNAQITNLLGLSIFKSMPLSLKEVAYNKGDWLTMRLLLKDTNKSIDSIINKSYDWGFLNILKDYMVTDSNKNTLKYFHLNIPHSPFAIQDDGTLGDSSNLSEDEAYFRDAYKSIEIIGDIFAKMQSLNIYDQTKIIVISDHGWRAGPRGDFIFNSDNKISINSSTRDLEKRIDRAYPVLLVKDFNETAPIKVSNRLMANYDLASIVCSVLEEGCDISDLDPIKNDLERSVYFTDFNLRVFRLGKETGIGNVYEISDSVLETKNWKLIYESPYKD